MTRTARRRRARRPARPRSRGGPGSAARPASASRGRLTHSWRPWNRPPLSDQPLRRLLDVQDPGAGGHPLRVAVGDDAAAAVRVVVLEDAVDHVGDGLEAAVRVPRRALRLAGRVLDLAHLVEVDERVEVAEQRRPANARRTGKPSPSKPRGAVVTLRTGRWRAISGIGLGDAGQDGDVVDGDGGHGVGPMLLLKVVAHATIYGAAVDVKGPRASAQQHAGVEDPVRIERALDRAHGREVARRTGRGPARRSWRRRCRARR